jgi:hypothetical protein
MEGPGIPRIIIVFTEEGSMFIFMILVFYFHHNL